MVQTLKISKEQIPLHPWFDYTNNPQWSFVVSSWHDGEYGSYQAKNLRIRRSKRIKVSDELENQQQS